MITSVWKRIRLIYQRRMTTCGSVSSKLVPDRHTERAIRKLGCDLPLSSSLSLVHICHTHRQQVLLPCFRSDGPSERALCASWPPHGVLNIRSTEPQHRQVAYRIVSGHDSRPNIRLSLRKVKKQSVL